MAEESADFKIQIISSSDNSGFKSASAAASDLKQETVGAMEKTADATSHAADAGEKFAFHGEGMRKVIGQLNRIAPGLGEAFHGIESAITRGGGALIVVSLAIEAAMTYWDMYKEKVDETAKAQAEALDKLRDTTREAREEQESFNEAMRAAAEPQDKYADALGSAQKILDAQLKVKRDLLKADEDAEIAQAKTPEEKAAIQKKYAGLGAGLDNEGEVAKIGLLNRTVGNLQADLEGQLSQRDKLVAEKTATGADRPSIERLAEINGLLKELDPKIVNTQKELTSYSGQAESEQQVHDINSSGRLFANNREISKAVGGIDASQHGERLTQEQIKANAALTQLFAAHSGGIQQMQAIIKYHLAHSTTQAQEINALKNALATLQGQMRNAPTGNR